MKRKYCLILLFILLVQCSTTKHCLIKQQKSLFHDSLGNIYIEYVITNKSSELYYTWIDYSIADTNSTESAKKYFFSFHGDLSLSSVLFDNNAIK